MLTFVRPALQADQTDYRADALRRAVRFEFLLAHFCIAISLVGLVFDSVLGGFRLVRPRTGDETGRIGAELPPNDATYLIPTRCTGDVFIADATRPPSDNIVRADVGSTFILGDF